MSTEPKKYPYQYVKYLVDPESKIATVTLSNPGKRNAAPFWGEEQLVAAIDDWEKNGEQDIAQKANRMFKEILKNCPDMIIDQEVGLDLEKYVKHVKEKV